MDSLVSTEWLAAELGAPDLRVVDATFFLPGMGRDAKAEYAAAHIPGAVFFDIDEIADPNSALPHMLPSEHKFASRMMSLGIGDGSRVVVYDNSPLHTAARAWWMLKTFGAHQVAMLDGGLAEMEGGRPSARERGRAAPARPFHAALRDHDAAIDKARRAGARRPGDRRCPLRRSRFAGEEPEPRAGLACRPYSRLAQRAAKRVLQRRPHLEAGR